MVRAYHISGEVLAAVRGGLLPDGLHELGLATDSITITPTFYHQDIKVDDFGPNCPAEVLCMLAEVNVRMVLVHYDAGILGNCLTATVGGGIITGTSVGTVAAGRPMGCGLPVNSPIPPEQTTAANRYYRLSLISAKPGELPWRFYAAYIDGKPLTIPIGTKHSLIEINWRCIPYVPLLQENDYEIRSSDAILFDHTLDIDGADDFDPDDFMGGLILDPSEE